MPRRTRTESGYAPPTGTSPYADNRDLPTNYGRGPNEPAQAQQQDQRRTASVTAHNTWWDNTGQSRDAAHGTQGNFQTYTDQQRQTARLRSEERGRSPEYRYY